MRICFTTEILESGDYKCCTLALTSDDNFAGCRTLIACENKVHKNVRTQKPRVWKKTSLKIVHIDGMLCEKPLSRITFYQVRGRSDEL